MDKQAFKKYLNKISKTSEIPFTPFYNHLDEKIGYGLQAGNIYTITGESGIGKTTLVMQIANFTAKSGFKTLYYSLDESAGELLSKCVSRYTYKLNYNKAVEASSNSLVEETKAIDVFFDDVKDNLIVADITRPGGEFRFLENLKAELEATHPKVLVIDSLDLIPAIDELNMKREEIEGLNLDNHISRYVVELKRLAKDKNVAIVVVSKDLNMTLEALSSVVMDLTLYKDMDDVKVMTLDLLKNRYGYIRPTYLAYKPAFNTFISVNNPDFFDTKDKALVKGVDNG